MPKLIRKSTKLFYKDSGSGPPLLFIEERARVGLAAPGRVVPGIAEENTGEPERSLSSAALGQKRLALAQEVGPLQLALRSVQADTVEQPHDAMRSVTRIDDATDMFNQPARQTVVVQTFRGERQSAQSFTQSVSQAAEPDEPAPSPSIP